MFNFPSDQNNLKQKLLVKAEKLELHHNEIKTINNLEYCINLQLLDLGFNKISSTASINVVIGGIRTLVLRNNLLKSTQGLEKLYSLEKLDISCNLIDDISEIKRLSSLPLLYGLWTFGNPVYENVNYKGYRKELLLSFLDNEAGNDCFQILDDIPISEEERTVVQKTIQQKRHMEATKNTGNYFRKYYTFTSNTQPLY